MNNVLESRIRKIREQKNNPSTMKKIAKIYGLTVKRNKEKEDGLDTYNVYDNATGELLLPKLHSWEINELLENFIYDLSEYLQKTAEVDEDVQSVEEVTKKIKNEQSDYEKKHYITCPICGFRYDSTYQTHSHF